MIHVMHLLTSLGRGGAERALADIVAGTDRARFRHSICYLHPPHDMADEFRRAGCEMIFLDAPQRRGWFKAASKLRQVVAERKPHLLHTATFDANLAGRIAAGRMRVPQVSWLVSMEYDPASARAAGWPPLKNAIRRMVDQWSARYAGIGFVACSHAVKNSAARALHVAPDKIGVIYNPVNPATVEPGSGEAEALRRSLAIPEGSFVYFIVGRMDAGKAHEVALRAFHLAAPSQPGAHLVMLGRGPLRETLRARASELGVADRVRFVESAVRIAPYFELADAFLFPSLLEGLPVAVLEAMCARLPVIVSDIEPHVEVVEDERTGLIVPKGSAEKMAEAMGRVFGSETLRRELGSAAQAYALPRFSTQVIVPQWEQLFERMAGSEAAGATS